MVYKSHDALLLACRLHYYLLLLAGNCFKCTTIVIFCMIVSKTKFSTCVAMLYDVILLKLVPTLSLRCNYQFAQCSKALCLEVGNLPVARNTSLFTTNSDLICVCQGQENNPIFKNFLLMSLCTITLHSYFHQWFKVHIVSVCS